MAKKKKGKNIAMEPEPGPARPESSPYTSNPTTLIFGPKNIAYHVQESLLQSPDWTNSNGWNRQIHVSDVDEDTGHVVVHYLYAGTYQTLNNVVVPAGEENVVEFGRAVSAYIAATKYMLHGLQRLAKKQIKKLGAKMSIVDITNSIKDKFSKLPNDEVWFLEYVEQKVKAAFEDDHTAFERYGLFDSIDDIALTRTLAKWMVRLYSGKVLHLLEPSVEELAATEEVAVEDCYDHPVEEAVAAEDCYDRPAEENVVEEVPVPVSTESPPSFPPRRDNGCITPIIEKSVPEPAPEPEAVPDDGWGSFGPLGTKKKAKKAVRPVEEPSLPAPAPEPVPDDGWGSFAVTGKKKKAKKAVKLVEEPSPPAPEPEAELAADDVPEPAIDDDWGNWGSPIAKKKKKKSKKAIDWIDVPPPPVPESEPEPLVKDYAEPPRELDPEPAPLNPYEGSDSNGYAPTLKVKQPVGEENEICPARARHLLEGDEWKNCGRCRVIIRQIAIQLARSEHSDLDGYEIVDRVLK